MQIQEYQEEIPEMQYGATLEHMGALISGIAQLQEPA